VLDVIASVPFDVDYIPAVFERVESWLEEQRFTRPVQLPVVHKHVCPLGFSCDRGQNRPHPESN